MFEVGRLDLFTKVEDKFPFFVLSMIMKKFTVLMRSNDA